MTTHPMKVKVLAPTVVLACLLASSAGDAVTVSGKVYLDANGNGKPDVGEQGLAGIRVTDSVNFVTTAVDGSYSIQVAEDPQIPYQPGRVVSVSWPGGKWPSGAWWRRLNETPAGAAVDFGLRADEQKLPFLFVQIGDDHGNGGGYPAFGALVKEQLSGMARFCINTGDLGYAGPDTAEAMFAGVADKAARFPVPMLFTPGNHDMNGRIPDWGNGPLTGTGAFTKYLGPIRWSFDYAGCHFAGVDWADVKNQSHEGASEIAAEWLERDLGALPREMRVFLFMHFPSACPRFVEVVNKHKVRHIFGGHNHTHREYVMGGVPATTTINLRALGSLLGVVRADGFDVVAYCGGCKGNPNYHSKSCALGKFQSSLLPKVEQRVCLLPLLEQRRGQHSGITDKSLASGAEVLDAGAGPAQIIAELEPGNARICGLKIGDKETIAITWGEGVLTIAGTPVPFVPLPQDKTLSWQILIENDTLTFYANRMIRLVKPVKVDQPAMVAVFAEGGGATCKKADVWSLKR